MDRACFVFLLSLTLLLARCYMASSGNAIFPNITTDQSALLALKAHISHDPHNVLTKNWSTSFSVCSWVGVICGTKHYRVTALDLSYFGLDGTIPPHVGNLSFLVRLSITNNSFHGSLPNELAHLFRLKLLDFGFNNFSEEIPSWMGLLFKLQYLFLNHNSFTGPIPPSLSNASSLRIVDLGYNQLSGSIPSSVFSISTLQRIYLGNNMLSGPMPSVIFNMSSLLVIDLQANKLSSELSSDVFDNLPNLQSLQLSSNQFYGELPSTLFKCKHLQYLLLRENNFTGRVPQKIGNLTMLMELDLKDNSLEGRLPSEIWNLTTLRELKLGHNHFEGAIPSEVGNLQKLQFFGIGSNNFVGLIPFEIFNISTIQVIEMTSNFNLQGHLPSNMGLFLPNLQLLLLGENNLSGTIPSSISNASQLRGLELSYNSFSGLIPVTFGNLRLLKFLNIEFNNLTVESSGLSFFSTLSNCIYLRELGLGVNPLNIILDSSIGNLSTSLLDLSLTTCNIKGSIPRDIGNLRNLIMLSLSNNELAGPIPTTVERLHMLQGLSLHGNSLEGSIPPDLCSLKNLVLLYLDDNELSGYIPKCMDNLTSLQILSLGFNKLTSIPSSLWSLTYLLEVNLSSNSLTGSLPLEIGNMKVLRLLDLSRNQFSGDIPITIGGLTDLVQLSLANNRLDGSIPESFGKLISVESLDLCNNNLSGEIPKSLEALLYLKYLNMSFNRLRGQIPTGGAFVNFSATSFMSNDALCGVPRLQVPPCKEGLPRSKKTKTPRMLKYLLPSIGLTILVVILVLVWTRRQKRNAEVLIEADLSPLPAWRRISKHELLQATEGFSANKLLGKGSFGSVYQGTLSDGMIVAIKVFNMQVEGAFKSFDAECEVLRNIRHRNLIKIISTCSNMDFRAFILEYMPNGSLEKWLYSQNHSLNILQRLNIIIDVASALDYLHYGYSTSIVHCDLKPSNVLLDEDMIAHVADFGIAKLIGDEDSMMRTMTLATIGYMAPEYGSEGIVSTKGDVYSYGILLMETFTRKKPTDDMFNGEMSLKRWIDESLTLSVVDVIDVNLLRNERNYSAVEDCISSIMELALGCCAESPEERVNTKDIAATLNKIKSKFLQDIGGG